MADFDVVIIGSGYGGAVCAARLAQAGMTVLVLERGERREPEDLLQSDDPREILRVVDLVVTSDNIGYRTGNLVGGASIAMDGAHFRVPTKSFETLTGAGARAWPQQYTRASLDPYYTIAEPMLSVRQFEWSEIPKGGGLFAKMLDSVGASCDRARMNYTDCLQCGFCAQGCIYNKKVTVLQTYIPLAEATGCEFRSGALVDTVQPDPQGYRVRYEHQNQAKEATATRVIVAAGGVHSPALLLRSSSYLPNLSSQVGENFNTNGEHAFIGILPPEFDDLDRYHCYQGMDNAGTMSFHWFDEHDFTLHPGAGLEPTIFSADMAAANHAILPARGWGMEYKRFVEEVYPHRLIGFATLGLVDSHVAITINDSGQADAAARSRQAVDDYLDRIDGLMAELSQATGVTLFPGLSREMYGTTAAHLLAACRMSDTSDGGVVDPDCQVFGYENLYVCDASAIPYALGVNPALTIAALAELTAEKIVAKG